jgi:hypothetical protein
MWLPKLDTPMSKPTFFEKTCYYSFNEFKEQFLDCIGGSCLALVIDGEIIWNEYDTSKSFKKKIQNASLRYTLLNNPSVIMEAHEIDIYMYSRNSQRYNLSIFDGTYQFKFFC